MYLTTRFCLLVLLRMVFTPGTLSYYATREPALTVPCPAGDGCFCDHLPQVHCVGLTELPTTIPHDNATAVVFDNCTLHVVHAENLTAFTNVKHFALTRSEVYLIEPGAFNGMQRLISLDLSYNLLRQGPMTFLGPAQLKELKLKGNDLLFTPNLGRLEALEKLWLSDNHRLNYDAEHVFPKSLREVHLDHCRLVTVPHYLFLRAISGVTLFNLDFNLITSLGRNQFDSLNDVESLSIQHNRLVEINKRAFESQHNLRFLGLAYNNLPDLHDETFDTFDHNLETLTLNNNKLTTLPDDLLGSRQSLSEIHLAFNPWNCDCYLQWMRSFDDDIIADYENFTCASPEHVKDFNVFNVTSTLSCEPPTNGFVITVSVIIVTGCLLLIGFAIFRVCKNKRRRAYRSSSDVKYVPAERR